MLIRKSSDARFFCKKNATKGNVAKKKSCKGYSTYIYYAT